MFSQGNTFASADTDPTKDRRRFYSAHHPHSSQAGEAFKASDSAFIFKFPHSLTQRFLAISSVSKQDRSQHGDTKFVFMLCYSGGAVAQSAERATPGQEVPGSIPAVAARSLLVGSVSV